MKKLLAMVLAAVMVLSLCSCATAEETVALRVWVGDNADLPWINSVIENFKAAHPEKTYDISVDIQGEGDCSKRVLNDTEAAADVFTFADDQFNSLMNAEALQQVMVDADEIIAANGGADAGAVPGVPPVRTATSTPIRQLPTTATSCSTIRNTSPRKTCRRWMACWRRLPLPASTSASR